MYVANAPILIDDDNHGRLDDALSEGQKRARVRMLDVDDLQQYATGCEEVIAGMPQAVRPTAGALVGVTGKVSRSYEGVPQATFAYLERRPKGWALMAVWRAGMREGGLPRVWVSSDQEHAALVRYAERWKVDGRSVLDGMRDTPGQVRAGTAGEAAVRMVSRLGASRFDTGWLERLVASEGARVREAVAAEPGFPEHLRAAAAMM